MKNKKLNFIIPLVVYPFDVMVSLGQTDEELKVSMAKYNVDWSDKMKCTGKGLFYMTKENQSLIRQWNYPTTPEDYGSVQHEIFHCVTHILDRIGMKLVLYKSDEAYSYMVGFLTTEIYKRINLKK